MKSEVRKMTEQDINEVVRIIELHDPFDGKCAAQYFAEYFANSRRVASSNEENFLVIEETSGKILGVCGFVPDKYKTSDIYWLNWTYVHKNFRRRGLGSLLLMHVIERLHLRGARKLYIDTSSDSIYKEALAFYKHFGFQVEGVLKNYYSRREHYIILGKEL